MVKVTICMGSSCFSRGNSKNLEAVRAWLAAHGRDAEVELKGCRCGGRCGEGKTHGEKGAWRLLAIKSPAFFKSGAGRGGGVRCEGGYRESCGSREGFPSPILRPSR